MYGFDGNYSAEEWAELHGFTSLLPHDRERLVREGKYTACGVKIVPLPTTESFLSEIGLIKGFEAD